MGLDPEIPDEAYGNDCLLCFPADKTPKHIMASFSGITDCFPNDPVGHGPIPEIVVMEQDAINPCLWTGIVPPGWKIQYSIDLNSPALYIFYGTLHYFHGTSGITCKTTFTNDLTCLPGFRHGTGGWGALTWLPETEGGPSIEVLLEKIALPIRKNTLFEFWPAPADKTVVKFCEPKDRTRIHIKLDPDLL